MSETVAPTITPTRTTPTVLPEPSPGKRLRPGEECPNQRIRIDRRIERELT